MPDLLRALSEVNRVDVLAAAGAVDVADEPVPTHAFRALADPGLRSAVSEALSAAGRCLVEHDAGWLSGYRDDIADRLVAEGMGVLEPKDRAVLAHGHRPAIAPGPQFLRLTHERNARLWEELVLLCRPEGMLAQVIRRRRTERLNQETASA